MEMLKVAGPEGTAVGRWRKTRAEKGEKRRGKKEKKETKKHHWGKVPLFYTYSTFLKCLLRLMIG